MLAAEPRGLRRGAPAPARLTVLSGPSAVGKSTVAARLRRKCPWIWQSVSVTTRPPRPGEMNGREYFFVTEREFERMAAARRIAGVGAIRGQSLRHSAGSGAGAA